MTGPQPKGKEPSLPTGVGCVLLVVMLGLIVAVVVFTLKAGGDHAVRVTAGRDARSFELVLEQDATISVWADLEVQHKGISYKLPNEKLPRVVAFEVVFERGEQRQVLSCNPFDSSFMKRSWFGSSKGINGRSYDGRIRGCAIAGTAGSYRVTVQRKQLQHDPRIRFTKLDAIVRY